MKIMPCPLNGPRNINEFTYGGEFKQMPDPTTCSDTEWADYVFNSDNAAADSDRHGPCRRSAYANERKSWASPPANCSTGGCEWNSCRHANAPSCKTNT